MTTTPGTHPSGDGTFTGPGSSPIIRPKIDIPEHDPRLVDGSRTQRERLAQLSPAQRAALVLDRYPELRALPNCDWQLLSARASFSVLFGESARHYAHLELAALAGILASAGISAAYARRLGSKRAACSTCFSNASGSRRHARSLSTSGKPGAATQTSCGRSRSDWDVRRRGEPVPGRLPRAAEPRGSRAQLTTCCCRHCPSNSGSVSCRRRATGPGSTQTQSQD